VCLPSGLTVPARAIARGLPPCPAHDIGIWAAPAIFSQRRGLLVPKAALAIRPVPESKLVSPGTVMPMPITVAPVIWLRAVFSLRMRPAPMADTIRATRSATALGPRACPGQGTESLLCVAQRYHSLHPGAAQISAGRRAAVAGRARRRALAA
jgi:hypothetical protein